MIFDINKTTKEIFNESLKGLAIDDVKPFINETSGKITSLKSKASKDLNFNGSLGVTFDANASKEWLSDPEKELTLNANKIHISYLIEKYGKKDLYKLPGTNVNDYNTPEKKAELHGYMKTILGYPKLSVDDYEIRYFTTNNNIIIEFVDNPVLFGDFYFSVGDDIGAKRCLLDGNYNPTETIIPDKTHPTLEYVTNPKLLIFCHICGKSLGSLQEYSGNYSSDLISHSDDGKIKYASYMVRQARIKNNEMIGLSSEVLVKIQAKDAVALYGDKVKGIKVAVDEDGNINNSTVWGSLRDATGDLLFADTSNWSIVNNNDGTATLTFEGSLIYFGEFTLTVE